jgi:hypothetical protein
MQSYHRVHVQLKEQQQLAGMLMKGRGTSRVLRRATAGDMKRNPVLGTESNSKLKMHIFRRLDHHHACAQADAG